MPARLGAIYRFPVKSCGPNSVTDARVEPWGLAGDRRWMLVDGAGAQVTAREYPRLLLVHPSLRDDGGLDLRGPDAPPLSVPVPDPDALVPVTVWRSELLAALADPRACAWFSNIIAAPVRLVHLDDPTRRHPSRRFARESDYVSFADGYPLLLTTSSSLSELNRWIAAGPSAAQGPVPMIRFRPSVVINGSPAWAEDGWRRIRIGRALFRSVKGCDRCAITLTDPDTAARGTEPIATLSRHRRWDGATWFGMNLIPDTPDVVINVGDEVEIVEAVPAPDGPPR